MRESLIQIIIEYFKHHQTCRRKSAFILQFRFLSGDKVSLNKLIARILFLFMDSINTGSCSHICHSAIDWIVNGGKVNT